MNLTAAPNVAPETAPASKDAGVPTAVQATQPRGLRLVHLWAIVPLSIIWYAQSTDFIEPFDFWWNVKSGQIMMQTGHFLASDVLVWSPVRLPYSNPQWGSQLLFYWFYSVSPYLLLTVRALIIASTMGLLMWLCAWKVRSIRVASVVTLIAYFTGWTNYGMRPQLFAFLPFMGFLFLLERKDSHPKWLPLLVPIMLFWVNVHGSFFLGVALLGIYVLGTVIERVQTSEGRRWLTSPGAAWQAGWIAASCLVTLLNPYLLGIYNYFFVATNDPIARAINIEWQAPTLNDGTGILFYTNVFIFAASTYFSKRRLRPTDLLLVAAFAYLSLTSIRNVIWWGWVTAPMVAANFAAISAAWQTRTAVRAQAEGQQAGEEEAPATRTEIPVLNWLIAVLLVGGVLLFTPLWRPANPLVDDKAASAVSDNTPVKLARFVKESKPPGPIFNYMEWGGYLEWELFTWQTTNGVVRPQYGQMFIDGRFEARQISVWKDYLAISRGRTDWQKLLDEQYGANTLILNKEFHSDLIRFVSTSSNWRQVYSDSQGVVYVRNGAR